MTANGHNNGQEIEYRRMGQRTRKHSLNLPDKAAQIYTTNQNSCCPADTLKKKTQ